MNKKTLLVLTTTLLLTSLLASCGNKTPVSRPSSQQSSTSSQKTVDINVLRGKFEQCSGLISVPVVLKNNGTNRSLVDSNNFSLKVGNREFRPFQVDGEASDFHMNFASNDVYQNTVTFDVGKQIPANQLKKVQLYYEDDRGAEIKAIQIGNGYDLRKIRNTMTGQTTTDLGTYYKKSADYLKMVAKDKKDNPNSTPPTVEEQFQDPKYDQFRMWVAIPRTGNNAGNNVVIKMLNATKTDFTLNYGDLELVDKDSNEYQVAPSYRSYSVYVPHGKYTTIVVPFEAPLYSREKPYHVEFRVDTSGTNPTGSFSDTKGAFIPAETIFSKETSADTLFSVSPDRYPAKSIKWSNQQVDVNKNEITATVQLNDYFNLDNQMTNYQVVSNNNDGSKQVTSVNKVNPDYVMTTNPKKVTWYVKDLQKAMNYQHVALQSNGKTILQLK